MFDTLPWALGQPPDKALFRQQAEHFQVNEQLDFLPDGEGDHLFLKILKRNCNTDWLARQLATKAGLLPVDVGYAGRKDRFAVTSQWFSLHLPPSKAVDLTAFDTEDYRVIEQCRHSKKLRKGQIAFNRFTLQLVEFEGRYDRFEERVQLLAKDGFPNYFGPQRFGHKFSNIDMARNMLSGKLRVRDRNKRSIYLSAARSYLFNRVLAERIKNDNWRVPLAGDRFWDYNEKRVTDTLSISDTILDRLRQGELSITGPMVGDGENTVTEQALKLETDVLAMDAELVKGIANSRVQWQRRPLRVMPGNLSCSKNNLGIEVQFTLSSGAYATSLLRELLIG